jgi:hypothetical protein
MSPFDFTNYPISHSLLMSFDGPQCSVVGIILFGAILREHGH